MNLTGSFFFAEAVVFETFEEMLLETQSLVLFPLRSKKPARYGGKPCEGNASQEEDCVLSEA